MSEDKKIVVTEGKDATVTDEKPKLDKRPEGAYVSLDVYPPPPAVGGQQLFKVERVCGDQTVKVIEFTRGEATIVKAQLEKLLAIR